MFLLAAACALGLAGAFLVASAAARTHHHHRSKHHRQHAQAVSGSLANAGVPEVPQYVLGGRGGGLTAGNDYPPKWQFARQDSMFDQWGEYNRECTSFVAWALYSRNGFVMPFHANAILWGGRAQSFGYAVNGTPALGAVAWSTKPPFGHVAYVVGISGGTVTVEEYNEHGNGTYDQRTVAASTFAGYIHFKDIPPDSSIATSPAAATPTSTAPSTTVTVTSPTPTPTPTNPGNTTSSGTTTSSTPTPTPAAQTYSETPGSVVHTWTDYGNAGGTEGPTIPSNETVQVACKVQGFTVADGDTWWYRIASSPWNGQYYGSADAFYNDGATSGSLHGTPFVDPNVPNC